MFDEETLRKRMLPPVVRRIWEDEHPLRWRVLRARRGCLCRQDHCPDCKRSRKAERAVYRWLGDLKWGVISPESPAAVRDVHLPVNGYTVGFRRHFELVDECNSRGCEMIVIFGKIPVPLFTS